MTLLLENEVVRIFRLQLVPTIPLVALEIPQECKGNDSFFRLSISHFVCELEHKPPRLKQRGL